MSLIPATRWGASIAGSTEHGLKLKQILLTHAHIDHVGGALRLKRLTGAPILLNENDLPLLATMAVQAGWLGMETPETAPPDENLADGLIVGLARYPAQVLHTPGHTRGSVCLYFAPISLLVAGDTLFAGSIGRTDLPGGNFQQIIGSIQTRLMAAARRDPRADRPRPGDHHRRGAQEQPISLWAGGGGVLTGFPPNKAD